MYIYNILCSIYIYQRKKQKYWYHIYIHIIYCTCTFFVYIYIYIIYQRSATKIQSKVGDSMQKLHLSGALSVTTRDWPGSKCLKSTRQLGPQAHSCGRHLFQWTIPKRQKKKRRSVSYPWYLAFVNLNQKIGGKFTFTIILQDRLYVFC